jgi:ribosome-binding factor A
MMKRREPRAPSQRQLRVGEELRHVLARLMERGELNDPALAGVSITVTEVRASPDLRNATVYVMPLGGSQVESVVQALGRASPFLRRQVAATVNLRNMPRLTFVADPSFDQAHHLESLLRDPRVAQDLHPETGAEGDGEEEPGQGRNGV